MSSCKSYSDKNEEEIRPLQAIQLVFHTRIWLWCFKPRKVFGRAQSHPPQPYVATPSGL